jgi:hypothetical protein
MRACGKVISGTPTHPSLLSCERLNEGPRRHGSQSTSLLSMRCANAAPHKARVERASACHVLKSKKKYRLAVQESRPHALLTTMRSMPAYFPCKGGLHKGYIKTRLDQRLDLFVTPLPLELFFSSASPWSCFFLQPSIHFAYASRLASVKQSPFMAVDLPASLKQ